MKAIGERYEIESWIPGNFCANPGATTTRGRPYVRVGPGDAKKDSRPLFARPMPCSNGVVDRGRNAMSARFAGTTSETPEGEGCLTCNMLWRRSNFILSPCEPQSELGGFARPAEFRCASHDWD